MTTPKFVSRLLASHVAPRREEFNAPISVGDVRLIRRPGRGESRHVLVYEVDTVNATCEVLLMHSEVDYATEFDVIVGLSETELSYVLVAQTDIRGRVWTLDLGRRIARVTANLQRFGFDLPNSESSSGNRGVRLAGPLDVRWSFKLSEGQVLSEIVDSCLAAELLGVAVYDFTPDVVELVAQLMGEELNKATARLAELHLRRQLVVSHEALMNMPEVKLLRALRSLPEDEFGQEFVVRRLRDLVLNALTGDDVQEQTSQLSQLTREDLVSA